MNKWLLTAGLLSTLTLLIHTIMGELGFHIPALQSNLSLELKSLLSVVWHGTTAMIALNSIALLWAAQSSGLEKPVVVLVTGQYGMLTALFIAYGLLRHGSIWTMPQWTILLGVVILAGAGLQNFKKSNFGDLK